MALTLTLDPHGERPIEAQLRSGRYRPPEKVVTRALESVAEQPGPNTGVKRTVAEAIAHIRGARAGIALGGMKIKDLIHEV